jgi:hypothetical protein
VTETECIDCGSRVSRLDPDALETSDGPVCSACLEADSSEPVLTVFLDDDKEPSWAGQYFDETEGTFSAKYVKTDAWRGYFSAVSDTYTRIHDDTILCMSEDAEELKIFDEKLRQFCQVFNVHFRTSLC